MPYFLSIRDMICAFRRAPNSFGTNSSNPCSFETESTPHLVGPNPVTLTLCEAVSLLSFFLSEQILWRDQNPWNLTHTHSSYLSQCRVVCGLGYQTCLELVNRVTPHDRQAEQISSSVSRPDARCMYHMIPSYVTESRVNYWPFTDYVAEPHVNNNVDHSYCVFR